MLRMYTLTNYYLSSIQHGIQSAHVLGELFNKYVIFPTNQDERSLKAKEMLCDWALNHKTMVTLNGGNCKALWEFYEFIADADKNPYPFARFFEDGQSLNNALTCVGIVLPQKIYSVAAEIKSGSGYLELQGSVYSYKTFHFESVITETEFSLFDGELIKRLNSYSLAK